MNNVTEKQIRVKGCKRKYLRKDDTHLFKDSLINFKENLESNLENKQKKKRCPSFERHRLELCFKLLKRKIGSER